MAQSDICGCGAPRGATETADPWSQVRDRYARLARTALQGDRPTGGCGDDADGVDGPSCGAGYEPAELAALPEGLARTSLGSGHPVRAADLQPGETVVDLGAGGGIDVLLAARAVGPDGQAIGVDATEEMVALAARHAEQAGVVNAVFHHASMEALALADATADVVISNCVLNLSPDKPAAFAEIARVLRPGGRLVASDLVADDALSPADRAERGSYAGCIAGALSFGEYRDHLEAAGLVDIDLTVEGTWIDGIHRTLVRARAPGA